MLGRWGREVREQSAFLVVLLGVAAGFVVLLVSEDSWRAGGVVISAAVLLAGVLRASLPPRRVGLLAVRGRVVDTLLYLLIGGLILAVDIRLRT